MRKVSSWWAVLWVAMGVNAQAQTTSVTVTLPKLSVAEYHKPYVAIWVAKENNQIAQNLAVLYDAKMREGKGEKWLKDMRQWWRRGGRNLDFPIDGVTGATKGPGQHSFDFSAQFASLAPGNYRLMVEAAREVGGRELLEIPFQWPAKSVQESAQGGQELAAVGLTIAP